jgi:hypothetical protein
MRRPLMNYPKRFISIRFPLTPRNHHRPPPIQRPLRFIFPSECTLKVQGSHSPSVHITLPGCIFHPPYFLIAIISGFSGAYGRIVWHTYLAITSHVLNFEIMCVSGFGSESDSWYCPFCEPSCQRQATSSAGECGPPPGGEFLSAERFWMLA